ncbi:hypothetical protein M378DRAFT_163986, partial [Amanita muscaria Koide BX008]
TSMEETCHHETRSSHRGITCSPQTTLARTAELPAGKLPAQGTFEKLQVWFGPARLNERASRAIGSFDS